MSEKFSIVLFSGTVDKLMAATTLAAGAVAMGKDVTIFLTFGGLIAFRKGAWQTNTQFSADFADYAGPAQEMMAAKHVPNWMTTLEQVAEIGTVTVKACGATMDLFNIKLEDLEPMVSEVTGVATFIADSEGGTTLFI